MYIPFKILSHLHLISVPVTIRIPWYSKLLNFSLEHEIILTWIIQQKTSQLNNDKCNKKE